ncbi:MAG: hypothetical protein HRT38_01620 [Alteromonadaceae bacterium]|nr:hypothetical protein [Alteromonadaceae bacterium]
MTQSSAEKNNHLEPTTELFFIYDTHCPWSYTATKLTNEIATAFPLMKINLWHCAHFEGDEKITPQVIDAVKEDSQQTFSDNYINQLSIEKDSTIAANVMAWTESKAPQASLSLLNALQQAHFQEGNELSNKDDFDQIISQLKLSPPGKVFNKDKLTQDAEITMHDILSLREIIGTNAIPALLLAIDDKLILLNHNLYIQAPKTIIDAIKIELNQE